MLQIYIYVYRCINKINVMMMMIRLTSTRMIILVGVNVFEDIDPGVDGPKVKMTLVLNHDPQQPFHLESWWL